MLQFTSEEINLICLYDPTARKDAISALREMMNYLADIPKHYSAISLQCERVTELEHAADDAYEDYVGFIFQQEEDVRELIKYKNIAEVLETATDNAKVVSDTVRRILLRYNE